MRVHTTYSAMLAPFILLASAPLGVLAGDVLKTNGFSSCLNGPSDIKVNKLDIQFDRSTKKIKFDVSGTNEKVQKVMAKLIVNAYGKEVYSKEFDPCDPSTKVDQLCPGMSITSFHASETDLSSTQGYLQRTGRSTHR
jgi:hypothetical protein